MAIGVSKFFLLLIGSLIVYQAGVASYAGYQNYIGVCRPDGRVLTASELLRRHVEDRIEENSSRWRSIILPDGKDHHVLWIAYANYEEFARLNPDCCTAYQDPPNVPFSQRLGGRARISFDIAALVRYKESDDGVEREFRPQYVETTILDNCGKEVWE